ncbi:hypothetical protein A3E14_01800 [Candidatus Curtissbacteria bacterium RIFCSPHIGHO2_12_FULL_41_13]|nr:MAG: hypothetical protein A3E14_01800 [Candidatus Curtissbacteria bacterium RIFCSPHIGHO2_12_FULL_41_13]
MANKKKEFAVIILAAGKGVRMKSSLPKVLHKIAGKSMITRILEVIDQVGSRQIIVVTNPRDDFLIRKIIGKRIDFAIQKSPLGTADAVNSGLAKVKDGIKTVAIMYGGDTAFYKPETILDVFRKHQKEKAKITLVTVQKKNQLGLGRIVRENGKITEIVEEKDASDQQRKIKEVNDGLYFFEKGWLSSNLSKLTPSSVTGELYLTDLIELALKSNLPVSTYNLKDVNQWWPIDSKKDLEITNREMTKRPVKIHIMGIAGAGASAVAGIAKAYGFEVTGCDIVPDSPYVKYLNIKIKKGHNPSHLKSIDMLVISPAVLKLNPDNQELSEARSKNIPTLTWQEFQGRYLQKGKVVITVAGAYGKSTTCAIISKILEDAGCDPTCEIGAKVLSWKKNFRIGKSKYYVCEADEYNDNFLNYQSDIAVILNIAWDHPDYFKTQESVAGSYREFIKKIRPNGTLVIGSDPKLNQLIMVSKTPKKGSDPKVIKIQDFGNVPLSIIGDFRRENANAALTVAKTLNLDLNLAKRSIKNFKGLGRRLEFKGQIGKVKVYDDYAVQPYTVLSTANALKEKFKNKKVVLVFEPHTFSRIKTFFDDFVESLKNTIVDRALICDIYAARERGDNKILAGKLASSIGFKAKYTGSLDQTVEYLKSNLEEFDVILSMGAGNIYKIYDMLKKSIAHSRSAQ